jgi:hypothetical protein
VTALRHREWDQVLARFPGATIEDRPDGSALVSLPDATLGPGWSKGKTTVWFVVPVGYPAAQPDCFWVEPDLALATGGAPANSGPQPIGGNGAPGLWFSWHLGAWQPAHDCLATFIRFIESRLRDAR